MTGSLKETETVLVFWYSERLEQMTQVMLKEDEDLRGMFVELYQNTLCMEAENKDKRENALKEWMAFHDGYFRLTGKPELYFGTTLLTTSPTNKKIHASYSSLIILTSSRKGIPYF